MAQSVPAEAQGPDDPKGLVREAYRIDGIGEAECRSILIDWALSLPTGADLAAAAGRLWLEYGTDGHPMTALLAQAARAGGEARRRGGRAGRFQAQ